MKVYILECRDDTGGIAIGAYSTEIRAIAALRHAVGKERYAAFDREDEPSNPDWHQFFDPDGDEHGTYYALHSTRVDRHA